MKAGSKNALALALDDAELQLRQELADKISQMKKAQRCNLLKFPPNSHNLCLSCQSQGVPEKSPVPSS